MHTTRRRSDSSLVAQGKPRRDDIEVKSLKKKKMQEQSNET